MKTRCLSLALTCLACLLLAIGICPAGASDDVSPVPALVSDADPAGTNVRVAPSGEVACVMPFASGPRIVRVLESKKGWFRVLPFPIEEYEIEPSDPEPPKSGDESPLWQWAGLGSLSLFVILILLFAGRRKKEAQ